MSIFNKAKLIITANGSKTSKLYALKPTNGDGDMVVSRSGSGSLFDQNGAITFAGTNIPRLSIENGQCPIVKCEPQRTNRLLNSDTLTTQTLTVLGGAKTLTFYGSGSIDLSGVFTGTLAGGSGRRKLTFSSSAGSLTLTVTGAVNFAQLEEGETATSYIQTVGTAVTRLADSFVKTGISSYIGQNAGSVFLSFYMNDEGDSYQRFEISDGSFNNRIHIDFLPPQGNNAVGVLITKNGTLFINTGQIVNQFIPRNQICRIGIGYESNTFFVYVNGVKNTYTVGTLGSGTTFNQIRFGQFNGIRQFNNIECVATFDEVLSDAEFTQLTSL